MLWDPVRLTPNPNKHRTYVGDPSSTSKSSCLSFRQPEQPDRPRTEHRSPAQASSPLRHLGLTIPAQHPGHLSLYPHLGLKPNLGPHHNPDSVLHIVIVVPFPTLSQLFLYAPLIHSPLHPHTPQHSTTTPVYKDPPFYYSDIL